ncbi:MAG: hypothetical protein FJ146_07340, partial [Deltaproteobacteria bacterium]|nr:hypothetical protein [Deltaproteobacteria bacterium]
MSSRGLNTLATFGAQRVLSALLAICLATAAQAQSAGSLPMTYSGRLTESTGAPKDGSVGMVATFWTAEFEGTQLGQTFEFASVILSQGVFSLYFPFMATQVQDIFRDGTEPVFIEISTSSKTYPRQKFNYVPLAMRIPVDSKSLGFDINTGKLGITGVKEAASGSVLVSNGAGGVKWDNLSSSNLTAKTQAGSDPSADQVLTFKNGKWVAANLPPSSPTGNYLTGLVGDVIAAGPGSGSASLATVAIPGTATKVTFDAKGRITAGTSLTATDIPPLSASAITAGTLPATNGGTGVSSTATFPTIGFIVTRDATETLSNKTLSGATIDGASSIGGSTTINTTGAATTGTLTASTVTSQGSVTIQGNGTTANKLVLKTKDNTNYVSFKAPDTLATPLTWELPGSSGTAGQVLSTNGSGTLSWVSGLAPTGAASGDLSGNFPNPTLATVGTAGMYTKVTTDAKGRVMSGATLTVSDLPPISATSLNTGILAVANGGTGVGTFTNNGVVIGSSSALSSTAAGTQYNILTVNASNQPTFGTVNLASGNAVNGTLPITNGGTGATTKSGAFDALSPMTAVGDLIYGGTSGSGTRLTGNTTATKHFLSSTGTGSIANAPIWTPFTASDIPAHSAALITSGTLSVANGGTGTATLAANSVLLGNGTSAPLTVAPGASGNILTSNGTTWVSSVPAAGSWTESGADVYRSGGNVGIGTTSPMSKFEVQFGNQPVDNGGGGGAAYFGTTDNGAADVGGSVYLGGSALTAAPSKIAFGSISGRKENGTNANYAGYLQFATNSAAGTITERMRITSSGNVGIGTTAPASILSIGSSSQFQVNSAGDLASIRGIAYSWPATQGTSNQVLTNNGSGSLSWTSAAGGSSQWTTSGSNISYSTGSVGIGTNSPAVALDVTGQIRSNVYNAAAGTSFDWNNGNIQYTTATCGNFAFTNMQEGASYTLIVKSTTQGTC